MAKKKSVPARKQANVKHESKFIDMPKEKLIKILIIVGVVILAVVLFFVLRRAYDGHLPVKDGVVVTEADNWIVANAETTQSPRYFRLGTVGDVEGYTRTRNAESVSDANTAPYYFTADDAALGIESAYVMPGRGAYDALAPQVRTNFSAYLSGAQMGEMDESDVAGKAARSFSYSYSQENTADAAQTDAADTAAAEPTYTYVRGQYVYLKAGHGQSVIVHVYSQNQDEAALASEETLKAEAAKIASQVTIG